VNVLTTEPNKPATHLVAERAEYDKAGGFWNLTNGKVTTLAVRAQSSEPVATFPGTGVNPETIALFVSRGDFVDLLSSARIRELLESGTDVGRVDLMRVRDARWANYLLNLILVLLTIPCVLTREPTDLRTATSRIFLLIGACMATIFITQNMAGQPPSDPQLASVWPALMAWLPIFIFGPIAIWLLDRLKT
jgi:lipopolysaccharide export LptBFGC system permease protein LptF